MTDEELDKARAEEALRQSRQLDATPSSTLILAARLARESWTPVDPDLIEAREVCASRTSVGVAAAYSSGSMDHTWAVQTALAGIKRGRELERGQ